MDDNYSLSDLAQKVGVSVATVSLALNNRKGVSQKTREKVLSMAGEVGYRKRATSSSTILSVQFIQIIRHGRTINRDHSVFIADYIEGITEKAKALNVKVEVSSFQSDVSINAILQFMKQQAVSGFIILGTELSKEDCDQFLGFDRPLVFMDSYFDAARMDFVDMDNFDSVSQVVELLVENGHENIGIVTSHVTTNNFALRESSFFKIMERKGLTCPERSTINVDSTFQGAYEGFCRYLDTKPSLPDALFCVNDIICLGVLKSLKEYGFSVPGDISIVGFDDLPSSELTDPPLTTIRVSKKDIGAMALTLLKDRIGKAHAPSVKVQISGEIVVRMSVLNRAIPALSM
jgi:LacI family transcriptional regulator